MAIENPQKFDKFDKFKFNQFHEKSFFFVGHIVSGIEDGMQFLTFFGHWSKYLSLQSW